MITGCLGWPALRFSFGSCHTIQYGSRVSTKDALTDDVSEDEP
jgi:hypothetical protein